MKVVLFAILQILVLFSGCSADREPLAPETDKDLLFVESVVVGLTSETMNHFVGSVEVLNEQAQQLCTTEPGPMDLETLRDSWGDAMALFHRLGVLVYAPVTVLEESTPLRFIYSPKPSKRALNVIRGQVRLAEAQKTNYQVQRPQTQFLGLNALEAFLFGLKRNHVGFAADSGECFYLKYVTNDLLERSLQWQQEWMQSQVEPFQTPSGRTKVRQMVRDFTRHLIRYTDSHLRAEKVAIPLGLEPNSSCEELKTCRDERLEHPFYHDPAIALREPLAVLDLLFNSAVGTKTDPSIEFSYNTYLGEVRQKKSAIQNSNIQQASEIVSNLPSENFQQVFSDQEGRDPRALALLDQLEALTTWLTVDFIVDMQTELPQAVQGDND